MKKKMLFLSCTLMLCVTGCSKDYVQEVLVEETQSFVGNLVPEGTVDMSTIIVDAEDDEERDNTKGDTLIDTMADSIVDTIEDKEKLKDLYNQYLDDKNNGRDTSNDTQHSIMGPVNDVSDWTPDAMSDEFHAYMDRLIELKSSSLNEVLIKDEPTSILIGDIDKSAYNLAYFNAVYFEMEDLGWSGWIDRTVDNGFEYTNENDDALIHWSTADDLLRHAGMTRKLIENLELTSSHYYQIGYKYECDFDEFFDLKKAGYDEEFAEHLALGRFIVTFNDDEWSTFYVIIPGADIDDIINGYCGLIVKRGTVKETHSDGLVRKTVEGDAWTQIYIDYSMLCEQCKDLPYMYIADMDGINYPGFKGVVVNSKLIEDKDLDKLVNEMHSYSTYDWKDFCDKNGIQYTLEDVDIKDIFNSEPDDIKKSVRLEFLTESYKGPDYE